MKILIAMILIYLLTNIYVIYIITNKIIHILHLHKIYILVFLSLYIFLSIIPLILYIFLNNKYYIYIKYFFNYWLFIPIYIIIIKLINFLLKYKKNKKITKNYINYIIIIFITILILYGNIHKYNIYTKHYITNIKKNKIKYNHIKIIHISDLHLNNNVNIHYIKSIIKKINTIKANIICITGDIFDNNYKYIKSNKKIFNLFKQIKSTYGIYACLGNHDTNKKIFLGTTFTKHKEYNIDEQINNFLKKININLLNDKYLLINNTFYLIGRKDAQTLDKTGNNRLTPKKLLKNLNYNKLIIVLDHQPKQIKKLSNLKCDIILSGHTHNGQIFPINLILKLIWKNSYGFLKINNTCSYVTSGINIWGPPIRIGTNTEIAIIDIYI